MSHPLPNASLCTPYDSAPQVLAPNGVRTWLTRASTFVVAINHVKSGASLARTGQPDEYMMLLPGGVEADVRAGTESITVGGASDTLVILPPGASEAIFKREGYVTCIFSHRAVDLMRVAANAGHHPAKEPDTAPAPPPGGFRIRHYALDDYRKSDGPARPFRSTNLLINAFVPRDFRRDPRKMTPHAHEDFDQASLALQGHFTHHLRYPWTADMTQWREDQHHAVGSPSLIVIPATSVHTTQDTGEGWAQLIDIFSPPRPDFVEKPGWLCNEADYPG